MAVNDKSAQSDFLISIAGLPDTDLWATLSGGVPSVDFSNSYDGGAVDPDLQSGNKTYTDVTTTRPYKAARDSVLAAWMRSLIGSLQTTATKQPADKTKKKMQGVNPTAYSLVLKSVSDPDTDAGSSTTGMLTAVWACNGVK